MLSTLLIRAASHQQRFTRALGLAQWVVVVGMFVMGVALWPITPEAVPVHWNRAGQVDRYGGRFEGLFGVPIIALVVLVLFEFLPRFDPHRARPNSRRQIPLSGSGCSR